MVSQMSSPMFVLKDLFPPGIEPGTFCVLGRRDNRYTTETCFTTALNKYLKDLSSGITGQQFDRSSTRSSDGQIFGPLVPLARNILFCILVRNALL